MSEEKVLTAKELADKLGVAEKTVRNWVSDGEITALQPGGGFLYSRVIEEMYENGLAVRETRRERARQREDVASLAAT